MQNKHCWKCGHTKSVSEFYKKKMRSGNYTTQSWCKKCQNKWSMEWAAKNPKVVKCHRKKSAAKRKWTTVKTLYGISRTEYDAMVRLQNDRCAICKCPQDKNHWPIDHCHKTKKVRGLLCARCNAGLGAFKDNPEFLQQAIRYLRKTQ